ncbi:hypothetical protein MAPG_05412 [Magnaporthiopsis poae ATCC 64411]|uniref:Uncharacterized protein n=1 Tax=Magnaporthiopsis poae (strain ATCC 64411 / 73-15) TaxID=644358 RepID=A0A0C4DZB7_MAGP6|nr:hypothetical protein MAPG_05412 [Magnaporthiopsis poae ATCC 64411]
MLVGGWGQLALCCFALTYPKPDYYFPNARVSCRRPNADRTKTTPLDDRRFPSPVIQRARLSAVSTCLLPGCTPASLGTYYLPACLLACLPACLTSKELAQQLRGKPHTCEWTWPSLQDPRHQPSLLNPTAPSTRPTYPAFILRFRILATNRPILCKSYSFYLHHTDYFLFVSPSSHRNGSAVLTACLPACNFTHLASPFQTSA